MLFTIVNQFKVNFNVKKLLRNGLCFVRLLNFSCAFFCYFTAPVVTNPCLPSPCGPNSQCREVNGQAVCTCVSGYIGSPPLCRPECVVSSDCPLNKACSNQKCVNPCRGSCGVEAKCDVVKHNPICTCPPTYTGDPFIRCVPFSK